MNLLNATRMQAGYTLGMAPDGRESVVVVAKGTFGIPERGPARLAAEQPPLHEADVFTGEPGLSAMRYESDYAPVKRRCDVLLNGSAYAPDGRPAPEVTVTLTVGAMTKRIKVVGTRRWESGVLGPGVSRPEPFTSQPISYDVAFGGVDASHPNPEKHRTYLANPVGVGFHNHLDPKHVVGAPLPRTEEPGRPVEKPDGDYAPMAFGALSRNVAPRVALAGTYDAAWLEHRFPFLPADFDEGYYQSAPADQQVVYPRGGEVVRLVNLTPSGEAGFVLPDTALPVLFFKRGGEEVEREAVVDTLVIEPDEGRFTMTWRASLPLRRSLFEVEQAVLGWMPKGWVRARRLGKVYRPLRSLQEVG